jgi:hypothetical protein
MPPNLAKVDGNWPDLAKMVGIRLDLTGSGQIGLPESGRCRILFFAIRIFLG